MILEAQQIYESLVDAGWDLNINHPDLKRPGKATAILAHLSPDGKALTSIDLVDAERTPNYWSQANGNHNNFPVNKVTGPLAKALSKAELERFTKERELEKKQLILEGWLEDNPLHIEASPLSPGLRQKLKERRGELDALHAGSAGKYLELLEIVSNLSEDEGKVLLIDLLDRLKQLSLNGPADFRLSAQKLLINLLFHPKAKSAVPVIWNLQKTGLKGADSSSPTNFPLINAALLNLNSEPAKNENSGTCSVTGAKTRPVKDKFPQPTFPAIGKTYIFARNKQTESLARYGSNGTDSFVVGDDHANKLSAALCALTLPGREGKTWLKVSSDQPGKSDLLLAYQAGNEDLNFAEAIGDEQFLEGEGVFEEFTKRLLERARGRRTDQIRGRLMISVISAVDPGNRKVILHRDIESAAVEESAKRWTEACASYPGRHLPIPQKKGDKAKLLSQIIISPGTIPSLTRRLYYFGGSSSPDTPGGFSFAESFDLLINLSKESPMSRHLLGIAYQRLGKLLTTVATNYYRNPSEIYKINSSQKWICLRAQSLFSILLVALNRPYETAMNSLAYQLGQLCAAIDVLHAAYCHIERGGDLPPRLIGNCCFQAASRNPLSALKQMSQRIAPHKAWFDRFKGERKANGMSKLPEKSDARNTVFYALKLRRYLVEISPSIASALTSAPPKPDDIFCSELLLGYLAGPSIPTKAESNSQPTSHEK
jgi:hypothetical protein